MYGGQPQSADVCGDRGHVGRVRGNDGPVISFAPRFLQFVGVKRIDVVLMGVGDSQPRFPRLARLLGR